MPHRLHPVPAGGPIEPPSAFVELMERFVSPISARAIVRSAMAKAARAGDTSERAILRQLESSTHILVPPSRREEAIAAVRGALEPGAAKPRASDLAKLESNKPATAVVSEGDHPVVIVQRESDLNAARMYARESSKLIGLRGYAAQKVVTAVSELVRNIACYAGEGRVHFVIDTHAEKLIILAEDEGPGIPNLEEIFAGQYRSKTGLGRGLIGVKRLADEFEIESSPAGTRVRIAFSYGGRR